MEERIKVQLKHCCDKVLLIDGENKDPNQVFPMAYFLIKNDLLYYHCS